MYVYYIYKYIYIWCISICVWIYTNNKSSWIQDSVKHSLISALFKDKLNWIIYNNAYYPVSNDNVSPIYVVCSVCCKNYNACVIISVL